MAERLTPESIASQWADPDDMNLRVIQLEELAEQIRAYGEQEQEAQREKRDRLWCECALASLSMDDLVALLKTFIERRPEAAAIRRGRE